MNKILLYFHTIKHLKLRQIFFRFYRYIFKPSVTDVIDFIIDQRSKSWIHQELYEEKIDKDLRAIFLNRQKKLNLPFDWHSNLPSKLWNYNLHYFEELLSKGAKKKSTFHKSLINMWIEDNPISRGNGWDPYPSSLRIVNLLKAWLGGLNLEQNVLKNIFSQSSYLSNNLEKHLLGNHYFANLKALIFAGVIFNNKRWILLSENELIKELDEQILSDGANFELSPMYHSLMLVDLLDLFNLSKAYPKKISSELLISIESSIPKMLIFLQNMSHPDGGLSFFNDSVNGIAPTRDSIQEYAQNLGFKTFDQDNDKVEITDCHHSGYFSAISNNNKLIFDVANIGPDYIPGHGHADTLSFELSIGKERVFVNSGISEYEINSRRLFQRKTISHNTVEIDGKDSSQVWSSFRVAKRAKIVERKSRIEKNSSIFLRGAHNGYNSLFKKCIHSREIIFNKSSIKVKDEIIGKFKEAKARFYIHPDMEVSIIKNVLVIEGKNFYLDSNLKDIHASLLDSEWSPSFGLNIRNKVLELKFKNSISEVQFNWKVF